MIATVLLGCLSPKVPHAMLYVQSLDGRTVPAETWSDGRVVKRAVAVRWVEGLQWSTDPVSGDVPALLYAPEGLVIQRVFVLGVAGAVATSNRPSGLDGVACSVGAEGLTLHVTSMASGTGACTVDIASGGTVDVPVQLLAVARDP